MIQHDFYVYENRLPAKKGAWERPTTLSRKVHRCTKLRIESDEQFEKAMKFLRKHAICTNDHPKRPKFCGSRALRNYGKIGVDLKNRTIYLSKRVETSWLCIEVFYENT